MDILNTVNCDHVVGSPAVSYKLEDCPRCHGQGTYGSFGLSKSGSLEFVSGIDQLVQQIKKILTEKRRQSGYGFDYSVLKGVIDSSKLLAVKNEVIRCLTYYKNLQQTNKQNGFYYNPDEEIYSVDAPTIIQDSTDLRKVAVSVNVYAVSGTSATVTVPIIK